LAGIGDTRFRNWYKELYATLAEHSPGHFPQQFGEIFATAYEREVSARLNSNDDKPPRAESG
jgi:predicted component of type VI protein secretion system